MYLGFDIGTTKICAVVLDEAGRVVLSVSFYNEYLPSSQKGEKIQDADRIVKKCIEHYERIAKEYKIAAVGISTQMHGMLYFDKNGNAVSPLYTWQDERGNLPFNGSTYAGSLGEILKYGMASGFGITSLYYDLLNGKIPKTAAGVCTIGDYLSMKLTSSQKTAMHESSAASYGAFDITRRDWDFKALNRAGIPAELLPEVCYNTQEVGKTEEGVPVYCSVGDNQASVYGAIKSDSDVLINIGTGSQISVVTKKDRAVKGLEIRPYFDGKRLLLGSPLCGGYSYELLRKFFKSAGADVSYDTMNEWARQAEKSDLPKTATTFKGTRDDPFLKASVTGLTVNNFNAQALTCSLLKGISEELYGYYKKIADFDGERFNLIGAGNAVRKNDVLRKIISEDFGKPLSIPRHKEEAAYGAAVLAAEAECGKSLKDFIEYDR